MASETELVPPAEVAHLIRHIRDKRVILDADLAALYGVQTRALVQAVKGTLTGSRKISNSSSRLRKSRL